MKQASITNKRKEQFLRNLKFNYDKKNDLLYIYNDKMRVYSNVIIGDFHIEFTKDKKIAAFLPGGSRLRPLWLKKKSEYPKTEHFSPYLKQTLQILRVNVDGIFGKEKEKQSGLGEFI